ncbi:sensor histidine kinase [Kineococcus gynurae]|uniref:histidine kinase n=1 Tax=Kineococcus gynurae TaxID=452979 RepID=A0ABV5LUF9_9ACTN
MRRRLLLVLTVLSVLAVAAFAVPLAASSAAARTAQFLLVRSGDLDRLAATAADPDEAAGGTLSEDVRRHHDLYGEAVVVVDGQGRVRAAAGFGAEPLGDPRTAAAVDAALRNQPPAPPAGLRPWSHDAVLLWRPVGTGADADGAVVLRADPTLAAADITRAWSLVAAGALLASLLAAVLALLLARWLLRPVRELAAGVADVMAGRGVRLGRETGPRELRELERSFLTMAETVGETAERQRHLVADASHQIRNPLAALQLRVDALDPHVTGPGRAAYEGALVEVDRLTGILDGTLGLAAAEASALASVGPADTGDRCDPSEVAQQQVAAWAPAARAARVRILGPGSTDGDGVSDGAATSESAGTTGEVPWPPGELAQVLDVLLDNAIRYAGPGSEVRVSVVHSVVDSVAGSVADAGADRATVVLLSVDDDGPGIPPQQREAARRRFWSGRGGTGLGLAIADRLVRGRGGELRLETSGRGGLLAVAVLPGKHP